MDKKEVSTSSSNVLESSKKVYNSFEGEQPRAPQVANNLPGKQAVHNNKKDLRKKLSEIMGNSSVSSKMEDCKEMKNKEPEQEDGSQALPSDNTQSFEPDIILKSVDMNVKTSPIDLCSAMVSFCLMIWSTFLLSYKLLPRNKYTTVKSWVDHQPAVEPDFLHLWHEVEYQSLPANISKLKSGRPILAAKGDQVWGLRRGYAPWGGSYR